MTKQPLLQIKNLTTSFRIHDEYYAAVDNVSLNVNENEVLAIVGESGCGKSALALSIMRLHNELNTKLEGEVNFKGQNLLTLSTAEMNRYRGNEMGMIFQDPLNSFKSFNENWSAN